MTEFYLGLTVLLFVAAMSHAQAYLSRPELLFAVTVTAEFRKSVAARRILTSYALGGWLGTLGCLALMKNAWASVPVALLLAALVWLAAFLLARRATQPFASKPTSIREASLQSEDGDRYAGPALALAWGPAIVIAGKAVWTYLHWDSVPSRIPVHWGFNGPDRWVDRTPIAVFALLASVALISGLMALGGYATLFRSRIVSASGPSAASERKHRWIGFAGLLTMAYAVAISLPPIEGVFPPIPFAPAAIVLASVGMVLALIYAGQSRTRMAESQSLANHHGAPFGDRTPDDCWKLGIFYYNPADPSFIVEKRFGIGWTWNFGNRWSWLIVPAVLLLVLLPLFAS